METNQKEKQAVSVLVKRCIDAAETEVSEELSKISTNAATNDTKRIEKLDSLYQESIGIYIKAKQGIKDAWSKIVEDRSFRESLGYDDLFSNIEINLAKLSLLRKKKDEAEEEKKTLKKALENVKDSEEYQKILYELEEDPSLQEKKGELQVVKYVSFLIQKLEGGQEIKPEDWDKYDSYVKRLDKTSESIKKVEDLVYIEEEEKEGNDE